MLLVIAIICQEKIKIGRQFEACVYRVSIPVKKSQRLNLTANVEFVIYITRLYEAQIQSSDFSWSNDRIYVYRAVFTKRVTFSSVAQRGKPESRTTIQRIVKGKEGMYCDTVYHRRTHVPSRTMRKYVMCVKRV